MPNGRRFVSMRVKFVGMLWITGLSVVLAALILIPLALRIFRNAYTTPENTDARLERYVETFATYIAEEQVRSDDTAAVVKWTRLHRSVYLTVFTSTTSDDHFGAAGGELWEGDDRPDMEPFFDKIIPSSGGSLGGATESAPAPPTSNEGTLYTVRFADGLCSVAVVDYSLSTYSDLIVAGGAILAVAIFFIVVIVYYHSQARAIVTLSREVEAVSGGALDSAILADRNDEIGCLARDVDIMRNTVIEKMDEQQRAWQANSDLLTSMTHDLRTPLTTLLGYLEILGNERESDNLTPEQRAYVGVCTTKAEQIKALSDKLFLYFWAYNRPDSDGELESFDAALLLGQLIGDYIPAMEVAGLRVETELDAIPPSATIRVRMDCLRRVTDNLFDNLTKYADPAAPVRVTASVQVSRLTLTVQNHTSPTAEPTPGTRIGHKTCRNMMDLMRGTFAAEEREGVFTVTLTWPLGR